jgi:hypothetical protein
MTSFIPLLVFSGTAPAARVALPQIAIISDTI